jgi:23S rRNA (uracil1939-C5)-methyltransferase
MAPVKPAPDEAPEVVISVDRLGGQGDGVGLHDGRPVFIPYAAPGDRVRVRLGRAKGQGRTAELIHVEAPGPARQAPPCGHFGRCGGCSLQQLHDEVYAGWKRDRVLAALRQQGFADPPVAPLTRIPAASRRRVTLSARGRKGGAVLGFHARASQEIVDLTECHIMVPPLAALLPGLRSLLGAVLSPGVTADLTMTLTPAGADLLIRGLDEPDRPAREALAAFARTHRLARLSWQAREAEPEPVAMLAPPRLTFGDVAVDLPPGAFLQAGADAETALVAAVVAGVGGARRVADLFAGCGTFTFPLARQAQVHALEGDRAALAALSGAARRASLDRVTSERRDLQSNPLQPEELAPFDAVVFDPPRIGAKAQCAMLAGSRVPAVVAVSCDPGSFARDARILADGGYRLERVTPIDQFVWSAHVEIVAVLRR